jgi:hypothetical protein
LGDTDAPADTGDEARAELDRWLAASWPQLDARLRDRRASFFDAAHARAAGRGLGGWEARARYVNLCCALGPGFEERPENEWALALLADRRLGDGVKLHQLVRRAVRELARRGGDAAALERTDAALLDVLDTGRRAADPDAPPLPRTACDIDALELRALDAPWRREYRPAEGAWSCMGGLDAPAPLRVDAQHPAPAAAHVLSHAPGDGPLARLQLRQRLHGGCGRHPAVRWLDARGVSAWRGDAARASGWDVAALVQPAPDNGLGLALAESTAPAVHVLDTAACGVRDEGVPVGGVSLQVWAWPAHQWLAAWQREPAGPVAWPRAAAEAGAAPARVRAERDGVPLDAAGWLRGFEALDRAVAQGWQTLHDAWSRVASDVSMQAAPGLLSGRSVMTWGWRDAPAGLAAPPVLRVLAELDLACTVSLALEGDVSCGASRSRVRLVADGAQALRRSIAREQADVPLLETLLAARCRFRVPMQVSFDPVATPDGVMWCEAGPCTGAVVGEAGLRPRPAGSGWQWFLQARVEPVALPLVLHDPVLGRTRRTLELLPALPLADWSLG